jgi:hypothetical protein
VSKNVPSATETGVKIAENFVNAKIVIFYAAWNVSERKVSCYVVTTQSATSHSVTTVEY